MNVHRHFFIALLLIIAGTVIYIFFREPVYFTRPFISEPLFSLPDNAWSYVLRYLLPDAFWCAALLTYAATIQNQLVRMVAMLLPATMEMAQMSPYVPGTFDMLDLTIYIILTIIFMRKMKKTKITAFVNCMVLAFFAAMAMASGSSRDAVDAIDGFTDGWQYGRSLTSDAIEEIGTAEIDSIFAVHQVVAVKE